MRTALHIKQKFFIGDSFSIIRDIAKTDQGRR
jgi:hypothetical protein